MKKIIFDELNFFNLFLILILRTFWFKVFFLKTNPFIKNKPIILILEKLGIIKIDFNKSEHSISSKYILMKKYAYDISKRISDKVIKDIWSEELKKKFIDKTFLRVFLTNYFNQRVFEILVLFEFGNKIQQEGKNSYFWINKNMITKESLKYYKNLIILKPFLLNFFTDIIDISAHIIVYIKNRFTLITKKKNNSKVNTINFKKYKTIFFTAGGIVTANSNYLNYKNFFFSKNKNSLLNKKNIIVCETSKNLDPVSFRYYKKLKLKFFYWYRKRIIPLLNNETLLLSKLILKSLLINDLSAGIRFCWSVLEIKSNVQILDKLPNLRNAIIDNEFQISTTLIIALKHKGIKVNCITKRLIYPAQKHQFIVDNYFIFGKQTLKDLKHQFYKKTNSIIVGGHESMSNGNHLGLFNKYKKNFNKICFVLDYHSDKDWYKSSLSPLVNWSENIKFYKIILKVSQNFPKILFVLKSKNYNWTKIKFFKDVYKDVQKQENLIFFPHNIKITNFEMTQNADFSIAKWTSLVDDFLMNNKPVIVYDKPSYITGIINYPPEIMSYSVNDLINKLEKIQDNFNYYNSLLNSFRKQHYTKFNLKRCQNNLIKVLR